MDDFVIIGAGAAGEAAAHEARRYGASVTVVERELLGGSCPFWACMPSKTLLHAAGIHALGGDYPWPRASARRDYMINREGRDWPDDGGHLRALEAAGARVVRGQARLAGPRQVAVRLAHGGETLVEARNIVVAVGTHATVPDLPGLERIRPWTNREATTTRELPQSLVILGGGPTGVELGQVFARYGVSVAIVHSNERLNHRDHPRNSAAPPAPSPPTALIFVSEPGPFGSSPQWPRASPIGSSSPTGPASRGTRSSWPSAGPHPSPRSASRPSE